MLTSRSGLISLVALSSLSVAQTPNNADPAVPACGAKCMSIKITEAKNWFGPGEVSYFCTFPNFITAYNTCVDQNCDERDKPAALQAGAKACPPGSSNSATTGGNNSTHPPLNGPANPPGGEDNSTVVPAKPTLNPGNLTVSPATTTSGGTNTTTGLNGALTPTSSGTNTTTGAPSRFSGAVGSAAANASAQNNSASGLSYSAGLVMTMLSTCMVSLVL